MEENQINFKTIYEDATILLFFYEFSSELIFHIRFETTNILNKCDIKLKFQDNNKEQRVWVNGI